MNDRLCPQCSRPLPPDATECRCGARFAPAAGATRSDGTKWVILAVAGCGCLLLGLALFGIVAAIVIPNFNDALQKAKQKQTVATIRSLGAALEAFHAQEGSYPQAADATGMATALAGRSLFQGEAVDAWRRPLRWACLEERRGNCVSYELASGGRDGDFSAAPGAYDAGSFALDAYDEDVVLADGLFTRWPEGEGRFAGG